MAIQTPSVQQRPQRRGSQTPSIYTQSLSSSAIPPPTSQRAELTALILALSKALEKYDNLNNQPRLDILIKADSKYAIDCVTDGIERWRNNGWRNASGKEVRNRDLIERAGELDDEVRSVGRVRYEWIKRAENGVADRACNECMDQEEEDQTPQLGSVWGEYRRVITPPSLYFEDEYDS